MRYAAIALMELEFREVVIQFIHVFLIGNIIKELCICVFQNNNLDDKDLHQLYYYNYTLGRDVTRMFRKLTLCIVTKT